MFLSSCRPPLASHGQTHFTYKPKAQPAAQPQKAEEAGKGSNGNSSHSSGQPQPANPGGMSSNGNSPQSTGQTSNNSKPANLHPDADKSLEKLDFKNDGLRFKFNQDFSLPDYGSDFDYEGCATQSFQDGVPVPDADDGQHFICSIHYCITTMAQAPSRSVKIPKSSDILFSVTDFEGPNLDGRSMIAIEPVPTTDGTNQPWKIEHIRCIGNSGAMKVSDMINAFGKQDQQDTVDVRVEKLHPQPQNSQPQVNARQSNSKPSPTSPKGSVPRAVRGQLKFTPTQSRTGFQENDFSMRSSAVHSRGASRGLASVSSQSRRARSDLNMKPPFREHPVWAFQFSGSPNGLGGATITPAERGVTSQGFLLQAEYQPPFLQSFGVVSIGPSVGIYPTAGTVHGTHERVADSFFALSEVGAQLRYQFHYLNDQLLVPYVSYDFQSLHYNILDGGSGRLNLAGGSAGLAVLLNRLAPHQAFEALQNSGVSRSYFVAEIKRLYGSDTNVQVSGNSYFFGIRCEF